MSEPRAAIDVGTNSVRLLVARVGDGTPQNLARELNITRLGEGVDAERRLGSTPLRRTVDAIAAYVRQARALGADTIRIAATSAVRDAANRDEFLAAVLQATGLTAEILSGQQEARASFAGAAISFDPAALKLVLDIGGGSTELVAGRERVLAAVSVDAGSVRLTERHIAHDPPQAGELDAVRRTARTAMSEGREVVVAALEATTPMLVGVAGTITTVAAIALGLPGYDREAIHRSRIARPQVRDVAGRLAAMTSAERRTLPAMPRGREDVIVAGTVLLEAAMDAFDVADVHVSETDILDGLLLDPH